VVSAIYQFVSPLYEQVRKDLVEAHREEKKSEEAKRLNEEASKIERIINTDFDAFRNKLRKAKAAMSDGGFDAGKKFTAGGTEGEDDFLFGGTETATIVEDEGDFGVTDGDNPSADDAPRRLNPIVKPDEAGEVKGHAESKGSRRKSGGGFHIEFINGGNASSRAEYKSDSRTIFINLDHPQISSAKRDRSPEDPVFRRLSYEVAFTEYAIALASELYNHGEYIDPSDPIYEIRESINRVAREAAPLYS
jgi:hypothetical protein